MKIIKFIYRVLLFALLFVALLSISASKWYLKHFADVPFAQVLYHIISPLEGTQTDFLDGFQECLPMPIIVTLIAIALYTGITIWLGKKEDKHYRRILTVFHAIVPIVTCCTLVIGLTSLSKNMGVTEYIQASEEKTEFYDNYYVNPKDVKFTFPEKKRNLIYIYLESMEVTFEDKSNNGLTDTNYIPELTKIQNENLVFNGGDPAYNGFNVPSLNGWTVAGIVGQTSGLPMNVGTGQSNELTSGDFLPKAYAIGNILQDGGYTQEFMCGSDVEFGGRKNYFNQHGNYTYFDTNYAKANGYIPEDYGEWWGYEDIKLFDFAKSELTRLSKESAPFNFTMLTADTHFPYGYECPDCGSAYDKNYSNVLSCSSKKVASFVDWIQTQPFFENTTIVIAGDHKTMDTDWFSDKDTTNYTRKAYYTIINPAIDPVRKDSRDICTYDLFPTTVAAMGIEFDSSRLGLGTNLFGEEDTLVETLSMKSIEEETKKQSDIYSDLFNNRTDIMKPYQEPGQEGTPVEEDISWQIPTFYTGDVYDYYAYEPVEENYYNEEIVYVDGVSKGDEGENPGEDIPSGGGDDPVIPDVPVDPVDPVDPNPDVPVDPIPEPEPEPTLE